MKNLLKGVHHIAIYPKTADYAKAVAFYTDMLGMKVKREWGTQEKPCCMLQIGESESCIEVIASSDTDRAYNEGAFAHIALATTHVDEIIDAVRAAGYTVTIEPKDVTLGDGDARIAFFKGPIGEIIEVFDEK